MTTPAGDDPVCTTPTERSSGYIPLPLALANPRESGRATFDRLAAIYDIARPGYPSEAIAELRSLCDLTPACRVLEIGCGTGQSTSASVRPSTMRTGYGIEQRPKFENERIEWSQVASYPSQHDGPL